MIKLFAFPLVAAAVMVPAPTAQAAPLIVINVTVIQNTTVTVKQTNRAPNGSNGNVSVSVQVTSPMVASAPPKNACTVRCRTGASVPVRSTRGQAR